MVGFAFRCSYFCYIFLFFARETSLSSGNELGLNILGVIVWYCVSVSVTTLDITLAIISCTPHFFSVSQIHSSYVRCVLAALVGFIFIAISLSFALSPFQYLYFSLFLFLSVSPPPPLSFYLFLSFLTFLLFPFCRKKLIHIHNMRMVLCSGIKMYTLPA